MGLAPLTLWLACLLVVRNQRILTAWAARQNDNARRAAAGLPPRDPPPAPQDPHRPGHRRHPTLTRPANHTRRPDNHPSPCTPGQPALPGNTPAGTPQPETRPKPTAHAERQTQT